MSTINDDLVGVSRHPRLLVACDYDGTLAPLVDDPAAAWPHPPAIAALAALAECAHTHVGLVSGRAYDDLARFTGQPSGVFLIGSHGAEFGRPGPPEPLDPQHMATLATITELVTAAAGSLPGARVERKPTGVAFHTRTSDPTLRQQVMEELAQRVAAEPAVHVRHGKDVVEFLVVGADKGDAVHRLRHSCGVDAVLFIGDDRTDEDVFAVLGPQDLGVKVGDGPTLARHRVADPGEVATLLEGVLARRR